MNYKQLSTYTFINLSLFSWKEKDPRTAGILLCFQKTKSTMIFFKFKFIFFSKVLTSLETSPLALLIYINHQCYQIKIINEYLANILKIPIELGIKFRVLGIKASYTVNIKFNEPSTDIYFRCLW